MTTPKCDHDICPRLYSSKATCDGYDQASADDTTPDGAA